MAMTLDELVAASRPTAASLKAVTDAQSSPPSSAPYPPNPFTTEHVADFQQPNKFATVGGQIMAAQINQAKEQIDTGVGEIGGSHGNPLEIGSGALNTVAGIINGASALVPSFTIPASLPFMGAQYAAEKSNISEKIADTKAFQEYGLGEANTPVDQQTTAERIVNAIQNSANIAGALAGFFKGGEEVSNQTLTSPQEAVRNPELPSANVEEGTQSIPIGRTPKESVPIRFSETSHPSAESTIESPFEQVTHEFPSDFGQEARASINIEHNPDEIFQGEIQQQKAYIEMLKDMVENHPAKSFLKYYGNKSPSDYTLGEISQRALGTKLKSRSLDSLVTEAGYKDLEDAQNGLEKYIELRDEYKNAQEHLKTLEKDYGNGFLAQENIYAKPRNSSQTLKPIEGTGELRTRGLAEHVEATAIEKKLTDTFGDLPEYRQVSLADQARQAADVLTKTPDDAYAIAMGNKAPPKGLLPESVYIALENRAVAESDVGTLKDLANSKLVSSATTMGQRIRTLGERDAISPVEAIKAVQEARAEALKTKGRTLKVDERTAQNLRASIRKSNTRENWSNFITSITC